MIDRDLDDDLRFLEALPDEEVRALRERFGTLVSEDPRRAADVVRRGLHLDEQLQSGS